MITDSFKVNPSHLLLHQSNLTDLLQLAIDQTPPEELPPDHELWRKIRKPTLREIITNPAYCLSNGCKGATLILTDENGQFHECVEIDGQQYDVDKDLMYFDTLGCGTLRHRTGFFTPKATRTPEKGGLVHIVTCENEPEHYTRGTPEHCKRPSCPACANYHVQRQTKEHVQKIEAAIKYLRHTDGWKGGIRQHVEISPPRKMWLQALTPQGYRKLCDKAKTLLMEAGILGGAYLFHPYRQNGTNEEDDLPEGYVPEASNDGNKYTARFGPHFHAVGMGFIDPIKVKQIYERTGWVIKALRTGKNTIKNAPELEAVLKYIKSHVGVISEASPYQPSRFHTLNWFGVCSSRKQTRVGSIREYTPQICPECGETLRVYDVHSCNNDISRAGPFMRPYDFAIFAPAANAQRLRALLWENRGSPLDVLGELDKNPKLGVCVLSRRQLIRMSAPQSIQCLDGSLHCIESDYEVRIKERKKSQSPGTPPPIGEASEPPDDHGPTSPEIMEAFPPNSPYGPDVFIDYHLPPGVPGVYE